MDLTTRAARDPVTGKTISVPANMTYKQWYQKYVANNPAALAKEKMIKNHSSDRRQFEKYKVIFGDKIPKSLESFQRLKYNEIEGWERLKASKQTVLNGRSFEEIKGLSGKLGKLEVRSWYKAHDKRIPELQDANLSLGEQAKEVHRLEMNIEPMRASLWLIRKNEIDWMKNIPMSVLRSLQNTRWRNTGYPEMMFSRI